MEAGEKHAIHCLSARAERELLQTTLFGATADLAQEDDPAMVLQRVCDTLVQASPRILAAWVYLVDKSEEGLEIATIYAAGAVPELCKQARTVGEFARHLQPDLTDAEQLMCFGLESPGLPAGGFGVRVTPVDYFERIGTEPLNMFGKVAGALLGQARLRARLQELAEYDALTGLLNRPAVHAALEHVHARAQREELPYATILIDVDQFKAINDQYGHEAGDAILVQVAQSISAAVRDGDWVGRWGGEEFLALLPEAEADEALRVAERIRARVGSAPIVIGTPAPVQLTISGGVACYPLDGMDVKGLLGVADAALYEAKDAGRDRIQRPSSRGRRIYTMASKIEEGLRFDRIQPAYQPIVDLRNGETVGYQTLARLVDTDACRVIEASEFIEVASLRHLIHRIDFNMIRATLHRCRSEMDAGHYLLHFVNVSAGLLRRPDVITSLVRILRAQQHAGLSSEHPIVLEVTERDFLDSRQALDMLDPFIDLGVRLAVDDFGSGYSSFRYLADLPVAFLKIEGELVRQAQTVPKARAIIHGIHDIASELGMVTLAEGVEEGATANRMRELDIDMAQGFHFGRPVLERRSPEHNYRVQLEDP